MQRNNVVNLLSRLKNSVDPTVRQILEQALTEIKSAPKEYDKCLRCGKKLTTPESRRRGYGAECYMKLIESRHHKNSLIPGVENVDSGTAEDC